MFIYITTKKHLEQYLKSHPGGPPVSEFDWGTGETPRRSSRISEKAKEAPAQEIEPLKKRSRKSSASKKENNDEEAPEETEVKDVHMHDPEKSEQDCEKGGLAEKSDKAMETEDNVANEIKVAKDDFTAGTDNKGEAAATNEINSQDAPMDAKLSLENFGAEAGSLIDNPFENLSSSPVVTENDKGVQSDGLVQVSVDGTIAEAQKGFVAGVDEQKAIPSEDKKTQEEENSRSAEETKSGVEQNNLLNDTNKKVEGETFGNGNNM
ncbi:hypothetical protein LIER_03840 [Lithospermum erythrorhizon]|uniref:Uncharacterized protein n=1 Tax=Lithospermum erythrorhizon TaxID=34254 RepID=A0AAV3NYM5_LITER